VSIERKNVEIEKTLYRLSKEISESHLSNPLLIGIPRRGDLLTKRISKHLNEFEFEHDIDTVNYKPFRDDLDEELEKSDLNISPEDRNVVLIDDVIYTGRTLRASIEAVMHSGRPRSITLACLIDRGHRELPITPKFVGKNIPTNESEYVSVFLEEIDKEDRIEVS